MLRIIQNATVKRFVSRTLAFFFSLDLRRSITAIGWSYRLGHPCAVCGSRRIEVYDERKNRLMVDDVQPYDHYPGAVCDCVWVSPTPPLAERGRDHPTWVSQQTVARIEMREACLIDRSHPVGKSIRLTSTP